jgi:predicted ester cyclase
VKISAIDIDRISDGKFVECWSNMDELGLMQQLGVMPEK